MNFRKRQKLAALNGDLEVLADAGKYEIEEVKVVKQKLACEILGLAEGNANEGGLEGLFESPIIPCTTQRRYQCRKATKSEIHASPIDCLVNALFSELNWIANRIIIITESRRFGNVKGGQLQQQSKFRLHFG